MIAASQEYFGLQPSMFRVVGVLAGLVGEPERFSQRRLRLVEPSRTQESACQQHEEVRPEKR